MPTDPTPAATAPLKPWVECECPSCGADWDVEPVPDTDTFVQCSSCGAEHRIGDIGQLATPADNGYLKWSDTWEAER